MSELVPLALAYAGFAMLAAAMHRHQRDLWRQPIGDPARYLLRAAGTAGLLVSFAASIHVSGWSVGPVLWVGLLTAAALPVALVLTVRPRLILWTGLLSLLVIPIA